MKTFQFADRLELENVCLLARFSLYAKSILDRYANS